MKSKKNFNKAQYLYNNYSTYLPNEKLFELLTDTLEEDSESNNMCKPYTINSTRKYINDFILSNYPNELTIKSLFIKQVLMRSKNHITIFELNAGTSRVDLCKINGKSFAFEIKTELDSFIRLKSQMDNYSSLFDQVYLICPLNLVEKYQSYIPNSCGIYVYNQDSNSSFKFVKYKHATPLKTLNSNMQLDCFPKNELINYFKPKNISCKSSIIEEITEKYTSRYINTIFKKYLKNKYKHNWNFLVSNQDIIFEIDYQWFFKYRVNPNILY